MSDTELYVFLGPGGVGKTTCSAAVAAAFAKRGKRSVVMTVDPALRLAQALGLESLQNTPSSIALDATGEMEALWLSSEGALEELTRKYVPSGENLDRIVSHRFFRIIESQLGGIEEYLGIEKALSLVKSGRYDVCVLDTPPSQHAIDFFESPKDLLGFFDQGVLKYFLHAKEEPGPWYKKVLDMGRNRALELFQSLVGKSFFGELSTLLKLLDPLHSALRDTARNAEDLLKSEKSHYVLVGSSEEYPLEELSYLNKALSARQLSESRYWLSNKMFPDLKTGASDTLSKSFGEKRWEWIRFELEQQELNISNAKATRELPESFARLNRRNPNHLNLEELAQMGEEVLEQWKV